MQLNTRALFVVYPNPSNTELNIRIDKQEARSIQLRMIDVGGREVLNVNVGHQNHSIETINFPEGLYFIQVTIDNKLSIPKKIIIQH